MALLKWQKIPEEIVFLLGERPINWECDVLFDSLIKTMDTK